MSKDLRTFAASNKKERRIIMSTPNFHHGNGKHIYAFGFNKYFTEEDLEWLEEMDSRCEVGDLDECRTEDDYNWAIENLAEELKGKGYDACSPHGEHVASKTHVFDYCGTTIYIHVTADVYAGYYEGASFDWEATVSIDGKYNESVGCYGNYIKDYDLTGSYAICEQDIIDTDIFANKGWSKANAKRIIRKIYRELDIVTTDLEQSFENNCERVLDCTGIFGNGEAVYTEAKVC